MKTYRLFTSDVKNGITDFGDLSYVVLAEKKCGGKTIAIIHDNCQFIVANGLQEHPLDSIDWASGHYFATIEPAVRKYASYQEDENTAPFSAELVALLMDNGHDLDDASAIADAITDLVVNYIPKADGRVDAHE